jgi:hypothetical protein
LGAGCDWLPFGGGSDWPDESRPEEPDGLLPESGGGELGGEPEDLPDPELLPDPGLLPALAFGVEFL